MSYDFKCADLLDGFLPVYVINILNFKMDKHSDGNILEGMYFCFKNIAALDEQPKVLTHQIFNKIFEVSELYNMDQETRDKVIHKMTYTSRRQLR